MSSFGDEVHFEEVEDDLNYTEQEELSLGSDEYVVVKYDLGNCSMELHAINSDYCPKRRLEFLLHVILPIAGVLIIFVVFIGCCCVRSYYHKKIRKARLTLLQQSNSGNGQPQHNQQIFAVSQCQHFLPQREAPPEYVEELPPAYISLYCYDVNTKQN
ncbi:hypothetical protein Ocin01_01656 [Orchesella cincta]|uniref:Uncharacterized protein n=1 Tax=Orchesella cincta TaxID=48709 RepID=A0A1D2NIE1_ORCCI|nr:hypothetical protein Ocin01_01656 [Orchesella cincta]